MTLELNLYETKSSTILPLYVEVLGEESSAYLFVAQDPQAPGHGEVWVGYKLPGDRTISAREHVGEIRKFRIPNNLTELGYNQVMTDPYLQRLISSLLNGQDTEEQIDAFCRTLEVSGLDYDRLDPVSADWYLREENYSSLMSAGGSEEKIAQILVHDAWKDGYFLNKNEVLQVLRKMRERQSIWK